MSKISFTITACNEHEELNKLLTLLTSIDSLLDDEIVLQLDSDTYTDEVMAVAEEFEALYNIKVVQYPLNNDFATYKNNLQNHCTGDWIVNIDADELPSDVLLENLHAILDLNEDVDLFCVPRWNSVEGITQSHIDQWHWKVDDKDRINWPDWQLRIYRNLPSIHWQNRVHEVLVGYENYTFLPEEADFCFFHPKTIDRQEKQNEMYDKILRG